MLPRDGSHFVKLFADAQFYSCKAFFVCRRSQVANGESTTPDITAFRHGDLHQDRQPEFSNPSRYIFIARRLSKFLLPRLRSLLCHTRRSLSRSRLSRSSTPTCSPTTLRTKSLCRGLRRTIACTARIPRSHSQRGASSRTAQGLPLLPPPWSRTKAHLAPHQLQPLPRQIGNRHPPRGHSPIRCLLRGRRIPIRPIPAGRLGQLRPPFRRRNSLRTHHRSRRRMHTNRSA